MAVISLPFGLSLAQTIGLAALAVVLYHAINIIYNLRLHPLSSFPGPLAHRASRIPYTLSILRGRLHSDTAALHRKYGPVVRVAPNELAFADPSSWKDVMGGGSKELAKWGEAYLIPEFMAPHLQNTVDKEHHKMLRRAVAPGFSDQSLRAQEGLIRKYIENLIDRLRESCIAEESSHGKLDPEAEKSGARDHTAVFNLENWYRFTVFDIIGDLALGESFGCLNGADFHPWIRGMTDAGKAMWLLTAASMYPVAKKVTNWLFQTVATRGFEMHNNRVKPMMERRMAQGTARPDLINPIIMKKDEWNLTANDMISHATVFIGAGSETTAGVLTAVTSFLLENPDKLQRLKQEEALRLYPQTGVPSLRISGDNDIICGIPVPPKTVVGIWVWSMYRDPKLFANPDEFHPERFLGDPQYANDEREALKPFFTGARDCIGRNLAVMELRLILAHMIYNFDMEVQRDSRHWAKDQKNLFIVWDKPPFNVRLRPVGQ
ncbi:hypothetical protein J7T55_001244 [Diaporthe amygdali]|uniref:uncharacterized protein n=1 Tax=Phomopsis amygdali TaxID=1214568 RepID=UPI0022FEC316|nr:uncharacterized protein J7T55_001244 [Diaporthe amygdali]KAJ0103874.1 hypothetical protein J7T55_001244 [Diaporthe amygdali]